MYLHGKKKFFHDHKPTFLEYFLIILAVIYDNKDIRREALLK